MENILHTSPQPAEAPASSQHALEYPMLSDLVDSTQLDNLTTLKSRNRGMKLHFVDGSFAKRGIWTQYAQQTQV
jgi:hypothetical protein